ncbi:DNA/RNA-binding protein AlbA [Candidatus Woesearchaeota archaeon]|nr:DNA/RNA-binding protein AlbA [Candidatus Woesearchaeota archaeon]
MTAEEIKKKDNIGNTVFIGDKNPMNYVTAVVMQFATKNANEVVVKARGKFISKAVDVVERAKNSFLEDDVDNNHVIIGSEGFKNKDGKDVKVSFIEITMKKK